MPRLADITWKSPGSTFKYRVAALVIHDDQLLLCRVDGLDYTFLPGGKVTLGETTRDAMARELTEELGYDPPPVGDLSLVVENIYAEADGVCHELGFYYHVPWLDDPDTVAAATTEAGHHFQWVTHIQLYKTNFQPPELIPLLKAPWAPLRHLVLDRRSAPRRPGA